MPCNFRDRRISVCLSVSCNHTPSSTHRHTVCLWAILLSCNSLYRCWYDPALPPLTHRITPLGIILQARLASNREFYVGHSHCTASAMQVLWIGLPLYVVPLPFPISRLQTVHLDTFGVVFNILLLIPSFVSRNSESWFRPLLSSIVLRLKSFLLLSS